MTAYKVYLKILLKNLWLVIMYAVILGTCSVMNMKSTSGSVNYSADKPTIAIYNQDDSEFSNALVKYLGENTIIKEINDQNDDLNDAIYYSEIHLAVYINEGFGKELALGNKPEIRIRTTSGMGSVLAETILNRYVKIAQSFAPASQAEIIEKTDETVKHEAEVEVMSLLDNDALWNLSSYFNFLNYSLLAGLVFAISFATVGFKRKMVQKRMAISATNATKINRQILLCNFVVASVIWLAYLLVGYFILGNSMLSAHGLLMIANSAVFTCFAVAFAFLLSNLVKSTSVLNPIINVVAVGSSFFCGVFIPAAWMPSFVLNIARVMPSYYFVDTNLRISELETINFETLVPCFINVAVVAAFTIAFIIANNYITKKRNKDF
jgi:ABC-2 type transport system permease protein